jgi:predicted Zn-dependent protease
MAARPHLLLIAALGTALAPPACVQDDGSRWSLRKMVEVSEDEEREEGFEFDKWARKNLELIDDPVVMGFVNDLGQTMVRTIEPQPFIYRFRVVRDPRMNAFAVPGGYIYFHSETLLAAARIDEVAGIMGHEIAHVKERHYKRSVEANAIPQILTQLAAVGATIATGHPAPMIVGMGVNVAFQLKYTREFEEEADRFGSVFVTRAGYDVDGMVRFFERIVAEQKRLGGSAIPPYLYTHPDVEDRIQQVQMLAEDLRPVARPEPLLTRQFYEAQGRLLLLEQTDRTVWRGAQLPADRERSDQALRRADDRVARGDRDGALAILRGAERAAPGDPRLPFRRGELLEEADRIEEAISAYRRTVELDPTTGLVLFKLGRAYADVGDRHRAVYYLEQAILHLGPSSAMRRRVESEIERVSFPVVTEAGLAESFDGGPVRSRGEFAVDRPVVWWGRIGGRHVGRRKDITVRWTGPDGRVRGEERVRAKRRPYVVAERDRADAVGRWTAAAEPLVEQRDVHVGVRVEGIETKRRAVVMQGPVQGVLLFEQVGQVEVRLQVEGLDLDRLPEAVERFPAPALVVQNGPQVALRVGKLGVESQGAAVGLDRLVPGRGVGVEHAAPLEPVRCREAGARER